MTNAKKIHIKIDGKTYACEEGMPLIHVAGENGIFIPSLCYYEHLEPPLGTCRVCSVRVNGKTLPSCTVAVQDGMEIEIMSPEMIDLRKAMVEMIFAEGNHFCPACEKSGDCDLQALGYKMGIAKSRFPHLFKDHMVDYNPERIVIEHNRCILCRRCVEEIKTEDGKRVFYFQNRGNSTVVAVDYEMEAKLSDQDAMRAMHICPVGAILVRGKSQARPFGERKYDYSQKNVSSYVTVEDGYTPIDKKDGKKVIATTSLAGCFGCHMSLLDIDDEILDLVEFVEISKSPLTDIKRFEKPCDIGLIEGGCCNTENIDVLRDFRRNCDILIAVGECAIWGGLPAMRNMIPLEECLEEAFTNSISRDEGPAVVPYSDDIPKVLDKVYPCNEVVKIDYYIPGCPPNARHIWKVIKNILFSEHYSIIYSEFKYD